MNDVISNYVYREAISQQAQFAVGFPVLITIILHIVGAGLGIYLLVLLIKLARRGIKLLDIYIGEKIKNQ